MDLPFTRALYPPGGERLGKNPTVTCILLFVEMDGFVVPRDAEVAVALVVFFSFLDATFFFCNLLGLLPLLSQSDPPFK
jgi:hypothetical protein